jgi:hypothetical protein
MTYVDLPSVLTAYEIGKRFEAVNKLRVKVSC